jgi:RimJ/RimL family protein N-acetyltransferase
MAVFPQLSTARLRLRAWRDSDLPAYAALNADPRVMAHMPGLLDRAASDASVAYIREHFAQHGFGLWAVEVPDVADFIGFVGLAVPGFQAHFTPCVELGWRLAHAHWGRGYATEGAAAAADFAFDRVGLEQLVSFTVPANTRSRAVMERLGMTHDTAEDFDHPRLLEGDSLRRHVLYRLKRGAWIEKRVVAGRG